LAGSPRNRGMIRRQGSRRIPPEVPIHLAQPRRAHQFEQFLDSIDRLPELPVADSAYSAKLREVPMHVGGGVLREAPLGGGLDVRLGPDHEPPVCRRLDALFMQQFQIPIPEAANRVGRA